MRRDPKTGVPLITGEGAGPLKLQIISDGVNVSVVDKASGRPLMGLKNVQWFMGADKSQLVITLVGGAYELVLDNASPTVLQTAEAQLACIAPSGQIAVEDSPGWRLNHDERIQLRNQAGEVVAVLKVQLPKGLKQISGPWAKSIADSIDHRVEGEQEPEQDGEG